jgi:oligoribonuclease
MSFILRPGRTSHKILWIDLETTGLQPTQDYILEIACIITDRHLHPLATFSRVLHYDSVLLQRCMDNWATTTHTRSGLLKEVQESKHTLSKVREDFAHFLDEHRNGLKLMCAGSSVNFDVQFLCQHMPEVVGTRLHYRVVDVSSIMELIRRWYPDVQARAPRNRGQIHRALDDIVSSLNLLRYYREHVFYPPKVFSNP